MSDRWETRFRNHPLWERIESASNRLADVRVPDDVDSAGDYQRINWLLTHLKAHSEAEDVRPYSPTMLDNVQRVFEGNLRPYLDQYLSDTTAYATSLQTAAAAVDTVVDQFGTWPSLPAKGAAIAAGQAFANYERAAQTALADFTRSHEIIENRQRELADELESAKAGVVAAVSGIENAAVKNAREAVSEALESMQSRVDSTSEAIEQKHATVELAASEVADLKRKTSRIAEAIANAGVARDFRRNALNKAIAGWVWDVIGLVVGGVPLAILVARYLSSSREELASAAQWLARLGITLGAVGIATLCFRRGRDNHREAKIAKRTDLRLTTVDPFLANQDADVAAAVRQGMAERIYLLGQLETSEDDELAVKGLLDHLNEIRKRRAETVGAQEAT